MERKKEKVKNFLLFKIYKKGGKENNTLKKMKRMGKQQQQ